MTSLHISFPIEDLTQRMKERLAAGQAVTTIVWQKKHQRVLIHLDTLMLRALHAWIVCQVDAETDPTGRQRLQFVFYIGAKEEGDGPTAGGAINAADDGAAQIAETWGADLQRVLWDAVVDGIESCMQYAKQRKPGMTLNLKGFSCTSTHLTVNVIGV